MQIDDKNLSIFDCPVHIQRRVGSASMRCVADPVRTYVLTRTDTYVHVLTWSADPVALVRRAPDHLQTARKLYDTRRLRTCRVFQSGSTKTWLIVIPSFRTLPRTLATRKIRRDCKSSSTTFAKFRNASCAHCTSHAPGLAIWSGTDLHVDEASLS